MSQKNTNFSAACRKDKAMGDYQGGEAQLSPLGESGVHTPGEVKKLILPLETAKNILLEPTGLDEASLHRVLNQMLSKGADYSDVYLQYAQSESWGLEEGLIKRGNFNIKQGVGVRATSGDKTGFAYADDLLLPTLEEAARYASSIVSSNQTRKMHVGEVINSQNLYKHINPLNSISEDAKIELLKKIDKYARSCDPRVIQVNASLSAAYNVVLVVSSDSNLVADVRPVVHVNISVVVEEGGKKEHGSSGCGWRTGYEKLLQDDLYLEHAREAVRIAIVNLGAIAAPAGMMPVVLGCGWPAVMLHEAVGHGLEADFNRKGYSVYSGKIGQKVASSQVSVIDQGNIPNRRGSINFDDEGTLTQSTLLIENGVLQSYMYDKLSASLMNTKSTGNGRRESYAHIPIPRMTNTYMLTGKYDPSEIIASVDRGIYAVNFSGGQVDITSGEFVFSTSEAYLIEDGKVTAPVKGATLIGNGPAVLNKVAMVGNNLEFDRGIGTCGKNGQSVPVGIGQPTLKISELTVGGTKI